MDTIACLLRYPWRTLAALAAVYGVPAHHHRPKEEVAHQLSTAIHACLPQTIAGLDPDGRAALRALARADGLALARSRFVARFGALHPYRPWNLHAPPAPWPKPASPAATVVHFGLAYPLNLGTRQRPLHSIVLPHDLHDALAPHLDLTVSLPAPASPGLSDCRPRHDVDADLFAFLSFLNRSDHAVSHDRWLPPRALKALAARLRPPDDLGPGRSELQAARIPFVHYLAEQSGLVGLTGGYLKPTLVAQGWLAAPRPQRLRAAWDTWRERSDANRALWSRYRLPALQEDDDPLDRFHALLASLATCPAGLLGHPTGLITALAGRHPALLRPQMTYTAWVDLDPQERVDFEARARDVLLALLVRHLVWFGVLDTRPEAGESAGQDGEPASRGAGGPADQPPLFLTACGAALLGRGDGTWPADPKPASLHVVPLLDHTAGEPAILIDAPAGLPLLQRFALEAIARLQTEGEGRYHLARPCLLRALQHGHTAQGVSSFLERASGEPLSAEVLGALYRWEHEFERVAIRQSLLLQTRDPALLRELSQQRRVRETLGRTLNDRTVEVRADRLDALLRRLARRGIVPRLDPAPPRSGPAGDGNGGRGRSRARRHRRCLAHLCPPV